MFDPAIMKRAVGDSFNKLSPRQMARNPVMFVVEIGSVLTTILFLQKLASATTADTEGSGQDGRDRGHSPKWPTRCSTTGPRATTGK